MGRGHWWFCVDRGTWPNLEWCYNTADNETAINLTTGKMARAAAECIIEMARQNKL